MTRTLTLSIAAALTLTGCGTGIKTEAEYPKTRKEIERDRIGTISGNDKGFALFGGTGKGTLFGGKRSESSSEQVGIGVNAWLWKASLDTISFMPLASADPFGGVILTDWYSPPETPGERIKLNIRITNKELRSDAVSVSVFRQVQSGASWSDKPADAATARQLENAILQRARQLKVAQQQ